MAIAAARCLARVKEEKGMDSEHIVSTMDDVEIYPRQAADVAMQAVHEGLAQRPLSREEVYRKAKADIGEARKTVQTLMDSGLIQPPPADLIEKALQETIAEVEGT
jgi:malate dehydrogenase (oxaloacetate-decarboxylating)